MKKFVLGLGVFLILFFSYMFLQYGSISPVEDITGCYVARSGSFMDKTCLYASGKYEQSFIVDGHEKKYNESSWEKAPYTDDEGTFVAGLLYMYVINDESGNFLSKKDLYIQPHENRFGKILFAIGGNSTRARRNYIKDQD